MFHFSRKYIWGQQLNSWLRYVYDVHKKWCPWNFMVGIKVSIWQCWPEIHRLSRNYFIRRKTDIKCLKYKNFIYNVKVNHKNLESTNPGWQPSNSNLYQLSHWIGFTFLGKEIILNLQHVFFKRKKSPLPSLPIFHVSIYQLFFISILIYLSMFTILYCCNAIVAVCL